MKLTHSKGPWAIASNGATTKVVDADGKAVCMVTPRKDARNGRALAEVPAMLAALRLMVEKFHQIGIDQMTLGQERAYLEACAVLARLDGEA